MYSDKDVKRLIRDLKTLQPSHRPPMTSRGIARFLSIDENRRVSALDVWRCLSAMASDGEIVRVDQQWVFPGEEAADE